MYAGKGPVLWLLFFAILMVLMSCLAGHAAAVDRPDEPGPYRVGYFNVTLNVTHLGFYYDADCRYYYPATSEGEGTDPDARGAPYPTIIYHVYFMGNLSDGSSKEDDRERIEFIVSHGIVVLTFTPFMQGIPPSRSWYNDLITYTDAFNADSSSLLSGMINTASYGAAGEDWGGSLSFVHACFTDRLSAIHSLDPWFGVSQNVSNPYNVSWHDEDRVWMIQRRKSFYYNVNLTYQQYFQIDPDKILITLPEENRSEAFRLDLLVAFFLYYLGGMDEYGTFLFGEEAKREVYEGHHWMRYHLEGGDTFEFQPVFSLHLPGTVWMDEEVSLNVTCDSFVLLDHPTVVHGWYLDFDGEPIATSMTSPNVTYRFTQPGVFDSINYMYSVGEISNRSRPVKLTVSNVVPEARIKRPAKGSVEETASTIVFKAHGWDSQSDIEKLNFTWSFDDGTTAEGARAVHAYDEPGTYTVTLTVVDLHGAKYVTTMRLEVEEKPTVGTFPAALLVVGLGSLIGLAIVATTEPGKFKMGLMIAPLVAGGDSILDNRARHDLHEIIVDRPGIHFAALREETGMANGVAAYHLSVLERKRLIHSIRDGKLKRFYPVEVDVPGVVGMSPEDLRMAIIELVRRVPGITQIEIMEEMGLNRDSASYYLRQLVKEGRLIARKNGRYTLYTFNGNSDER